MKKKIFLLLIIGIAMSIPKVYAQNVEVINGLYKSRAMIKRKPIPYTPIDESDILWSRTVWRIIDLKKDMNTHLYYPLEHTKTKFNLIQLLLYGVQYKGLKAYSTEYEDEFKKQMTYDQLKQALGAGKDTVDIKQADGTFSTQVVSGEMNTQEVKKIMLKEIWYFDKKYSKVDVRIIGLCPIREYIKEDLGQDDLTQDSSDVRRKAMCWFYYPAIRNLLAQYEVFNPKNNTQDMTFDDIFIQRHFDSYIINKSYNNSENDSTKSAITDTVGTWRIRQEILNFEHGLWVNDDTGKSYNK